MSDEALSAAEFARRTNVKPSYVTLLKQQGRLVLDEAGKILLEASRVRIAETRDPSRQAVADRHAAARAEASGEGDDEIEAEDTAEPSSPGNGKYQESRALKEHYLAMAAKRDYEISMGKLLDRDDCVAVTAAAATNFRRGVANMIDAYAPQLAATTAEPQVKALLREATDHLLSELEREFSAMAKQGEDA